MSANRIIRVLWILLIVILSISKENFLPKIVNSSNVINATLNETVELSITAVDEGTITFQVINKPVGATWNQTGNMLLFYWPVASSQKFNMTFVAIDDKGSSTSWIPTVRMCPCQHDGQCVEPEKGDTANTDNKFVYMGCACQGGYTGRFCDSDIDTCEMNGQPCYTGVECTDLPTPANSSGYKCGPCPSRYTGDGAQCVDYDECQSSSSNNCEQMCVNIPVSFFCECRDGYALNDDGRRCDDVDECNPSSDCMQTCINSVGSYNCSCDEFFKTDPSDWRKCVATNPCSANHGCEHVCFMGSSGEAGCACFANFELDTDGKKCIDVNECDPAKKLHRCDQICTNTPGSYNCSCEKGFQLKKDGYECEDINECLNDDLFNCADEFHKCVNTRGSYKCECDQDLYFIDGKCRGLEKNETAPLPDLPEPRVPSESEKQEAVRFSIPSGVEWDFNKDKSFKEKLASVTTEFCSQNRTTCALKETRRKRRSPLFDLYTADQVHLLPGYPINSSDSIRVAFYVQQPAGLFVGNISALPRDALVSITKLYKPQIEKVIGANISDIETLFELSPPKEYPTVGPQEPGNNGSKWTVIGISVGLFVLIVAIIYIILVSFTLRTKGKSARKTESYHYPEDGINMTSF